MTRWTEKMVFLSSQATPAFPAFQHLLLFQNLATVSLFPAHLTLNSSRRYGLHFQFFVGAEVGVIFLLSYKSSSQNELTQPVRTYFLKM